METVSCHNSVAGHRIATIFCTCHDSTAVVPCTKFCSDHCIRIEVRVKRYFHRIWIAMEKTLVKRAPERVLTAFISPPHSGRGLGGNKPISSVPLLSRFSPLPKHLQPMECHVYIWQVSPQFSCGDTHQIWKWFEEFTRYICQIKNFFNGKLTNWV